MKIAVLHTGHARNYERCINNWKLGVKDRYDVDFYFGVWNERGTKLDGTPDNARQWEGHLMPGQQYEAVVDRTMISKDELLENLCPTLTTEDKVLYLQHDDHHNIIMDNMVKSGAINTNRGHHTYALWMGGHQGRWIPTTSWHQWYMVRETYKLVEQSGVEYDLVIRTRMDTAWVGYPVFEKYEQIQIPYNAPGVPHDYLLYGPQDLMSAVCKLYDYFPIMYNNQREFLGAGTDCHISLTWMSKYMVPVQDNQKNLMSVIRKDSYINHKDTAFLLEEEHSNAWRNPAVNTSANYTG